VWLVLDFIPVFCDDRMIGLSLLLPPLCCFDDQVEWMIKVQVLWLDHLVIWNIQTGLALLGVLKKCKLVSFVWSFESLAWNNEVFFS
jgi:hypothetical protein